MNNINHYIFMKTYVSHLWLCYWIFRVVNLILGVLLGETTTSNVYILGYTHYKSICKGVTWLHCIPECGGIPLKFRNP